MTPTEYEMQATHLRRRIAELEQTVRMLKEGGHVTDAGRRVPEVTDADGVPIRVGDALRHLCGGSRVTVTEVRPDGLVRARRPDGGESLLLSERLTRREPDSWERLEEDARQLDIDFDDTADDYPRMGCVRDIVRRAKALADWAGDAE